MSGGSSQPTGGAASDVEAIHDAGVSKHTRVKYKSSLNGIKRWIVEELSKEDANTSRFFEEHDELVLTEFTPAFFLAFPGIQTQFCQNCHFKWIPECY
ncbi:hypothetical protein L917_01675 [Phytophthora nicotianae]|uniref:Uncharacterized protein n=1 Tax=Phytophthora nicotianae TaxID=4792 RepID=W2LWJ1_PHYNI|nr:hypothetical protein L917_01675 [Phytophthora nicotianae]